MFRFLEKLKGFRNFDFNLFFDFCLYFKSQRYFLNIFNDCVVLTFFRQLIVNVKKLLFKKTVNFSNFFEKIFGGRVKIIF